MTSTVPAQTLQATTLSRLRRTGMLAGAAFTGFVVAHAPTLALVAIGLPTLLLAVVAFSETVLVLFLTAGVYKQDPYLLSVMPLDTTVCMAIFLALATAIGAFRRSIHLPTATWLLVPVFLAVALSFVRGANAYGAEKGLRFCTLTLLGVVAALTLLGERRGFHRFLGSLAVLAAFMSIYASFSPSSTSEGRMTLHGSSPISFGRIAALALAFGWLRVHFSRKPFEIVVAIAILAVACFGLLAAGSRGPMISLLGSMTLISLVTAPRHGRSPMSLKLVALIVGFGFVAVLFANIPALPLDRFKLLFSEDKGTSIFSRSILFITAWKLLITHPLGLGVGGFAEYAILDLRYPHNLFLEVGSELGWVPLGCLLALCAWTLRTLVQVLRTEYTWFSVYLAVLVLTSLANSMVTGDLNDNRMLFAVLLLPFVYRHIQIREPEEAAHGSPATPNAVHANARASRVGSGDLDTRGSGVVPR